MAVEEDVLREAKKRHLSTLEKKRKQSPSKCQACFSFLVIVTMCLTGFNTIVTGIISEEWRDKFHISNEQLARVWMLEGIGIVFSSLTCSLLLCIETCFGFGVGAVLMSIFPCTINFVCFQLSGLAAGFGKGLIFVYGTHILSLWPKSSALVLIQLSFASYSLGGIIASQLSGYYKFVIIVWRSNITSNEFKNSTVGIKHEDVEMSSFIKDEHFKIPFIQAVIFFVCCFVFFITLIWSIYRCRGKINSRQMSDSTGAYEEFKSVNKSITLEKIHQDRQISIDSDLHFFTNKNQKWLANNQVLDVALLMFLFTHFVFSFGMESILAKFLGIVDSISFSTNKHKKLFNGFNVYSIVCGLTVLGRFVSLTFSRSYSSTAIVAVCLATNVVATTILSAYYDKSENLALFCIAVFSAFLSPLLPGGLSWANSYLSYSPKSLGLAISGAGVGCSSFSWISGLIANTFSGLHLMFLITGSCCFCCISYIPLLVKVKQVENIISPTVTYV